MTARPRGRYSLACKLTPTTAAQICEHVRSGLFRYNAAALIGVSARTLERWAALGRENLDERERAEQLDDGAELPPLNRFGRFLVALESAEAEAEAQVLGVVHRLATSCKDPQTRLRAATWYLERKAPALYGRAAMRVNLGIGDSGNPDEPNVIDVVLMNIERAEKRLTAAQQGDDDAGAGE